MPNSPYRHLILCCLVLFSCAACVSAPKNAKTVSGERVHEPGKSRERCVDWLTQGDLTYSRWNLLLDELDAEPPAIRAQTIKRLQVQLDHWPDHMRVIPKHWTPIDLKRRADVLTLVRHFDLSRLNYTWYKHGLTTPMPHISTISLRTTHHAKDIATTPKHFTGLKHISFYLIGKQLEDHLEAILKSDVASQLETIEFISSGTTQKALRLLAMHADKLPNLKHLKIQGIGYRYNREQFTESIQALVATKMFSQLHSLSFRNTRAQHISALINAIEKGPSLPKLHTLNISFAQILEPDLIVLAKSRKWVALKHLNISGNRLTENGVKAISQSNILSGLETMNLRLTNLTDNSAGWLGYSDVLKQTKNLDISRNRITDAGIWRLLGHGRLQNLHELRLQGNRLTTKTAEHLAKTKHLQNLELLDLRWARIGDPGAIAIAKIPMNLKHLLLASNNITAVGANAIARAPWAKTIKTLDLNRNRIGDEGVIALATIKGFMKTLLLNDNSIGDSGIKALIKSDIVRLLEHLSLNHNEWTHKGATALGQAKTMERLMTLELRYSKLGKPENLERMANSPSTLHMARIRLSFEYIDVGDKKQYQENLNKKQLSIGVKMSHVPALGEKVIKSPYLSASIRRAIDAELQKSIRFLEDNPQAKRDVPATLLMMAVGYLKRMDELNREKLPSHALPPKPKPRAFKNGQPVRMRPPFR